MKKLALLLSILSLSSCATSGKINNIQVGMVKSEVIEKMGSPVSVSATKGTEYLNYKLSETDDDAFRGWSTPYYVRLVNGKVDSFGRSGDFDSTKTPTIKIEKDENITIESSVKGNGDLYTELRKLKELKDDGIVSDEEFRVLKKKIIDSH